MPPTLIPKPAVRRVNKIVKIPRAARANVPVPQKIVNNIPRKAVKTPKAFQQQVRTKQTAIKRSAAVKAHQPAAVPPKRRIKKSNQAVVSQRKRLVTKFTKQKDPKILYRGNEIDEAGKKKIERLKDTGKGKLLLIIGNGPSLLDADIPKLKKHSLIDIMSINKPDRRLWPTSHWLFCDSSQYRRHEDLWKHYQGVLINTTAIKNRKGNTVVVKNIGGMGFSQNLVEGFHIGRSSVYAAMQAALWLGYEHIYIFGCDMASKIVNGKELVHFYGVNPDVDPNNRKTRFEQEAKYYRYAAGKLSADIRKKYTFCSSLLKFDFTAKFNKMDHIKAVDHVLDHAKRLEKTSGK